MRHQDALIAEIRVLPGGDVLHQVEAQAVGREGVGQHVRIDHIAQALADLAAAQVPPAMDDQLRDLFILEAHRMQHRGPVDRVRRAQDVLANHVRVRRPQALEIRQAGVAHLLCQIAREADVVHQRIEPHVVHEVRIKRQRDAPGETFLRARNAQVDGARAFQGVDHVIGAEGRENEVRVAANESLQPLHVLAQLEVPVLLLKLHHLAPLLAPGAVFTTLLLGKELLLAHRIEPLTRGLVELPGIVQIRQDRLHHLLVRLRRGRGPAVVMHAQLLPQRGEMLGDAINECLRLQPCFRRLLLHLLAMLIHAREEVHLTPGQPLVARHHIRQHLLIRMADVRRSIGVVDGGRDEIRLHEW